MRLPHNREGGERPDMRRHVSNVIIFERGRSSAHNSATSSCAHAAGREISRVTSDKSE